jgi:HSP20 family protein
MATTEKAAAPAAEKARPVARERARHPLVSLREEMDRMFERFWPGFGLPASGRWPELEPFWRVTGLAAPAVDLVETDKDYRIKAELPGMDEKDIELSLTEDMLSIKGEKKEEHEEKEEGYYLAERRYGAFERSFRLPEEVEADKIEASFQKGVLTVILPKSPKAQQKQARKIGIKAA